ncbi:MAG: hypothetical protein HZC37_01425 [Burkholderiales bacterium]|nr:hypothetical protein [Burkholderiales bacterium]
MHKAMYALAAAAAVALAAPAHAASHIVDIAWGPDGAFVHRANVDPGKFVEVCGRLDPGAAIRWGFEASAPVDFNIHYHVGKEVEFPAKQAQVSAGHDTLRVAVREDYCWMWSNKSSGRVQIDISLRR